jgi:hypothetical protein
VWAVVGGRGPAWEEKKRAGPNEFDSIKRWVSFDQICLNET